MRTVPREEQEKYRKAVDLGVILTGHPETEVTPEDIEGWQSHDLYDWLATWGYDYQDESWAYEGAI